MRPTRRQLLLAAGAAGVGLLVSGWERAREGLRGLLASREQRILRAYFADPDAAAAVGRRYRSSPPSGAAARVEASAALDALLSDSDLSTQRAAEHLGERVRADLAAGRTARVDGWHLALTELEAAARLPDLRAP